LKETTYKQLFLLNPHRLIPACRKLGKTRSVLDFRILSKPVAATEIAFGKRRLIWSTAYYFTNFLMPAI